MNQLKLSGKEKGNAHVNVTYAVGTTAYCKTAPWFEVSVDRGSW